MLVNKLSTENLNLLPTRKDLQRICKSISALEAIICPDWQYRYYSYQNNWSKTEELCEMRDGQGDQMLILFSTNGTCINGFAHKSTMNGWRNIPIKEEKPFMKKLFGSKKEAKTELTQIISKGVIDDLPQVFNEFIFGEPVKSIGTTFCIWQTDIDSSWKSGKVDLPADEYKDGSIDLLQLLDGKPLTYKNWAEGYYEKNELKLEIVDIIYRGDLITRELVHQLNPELVDFEQLKSDLDEIGYEHKI